MSGRLCMFCKCGYPYKPCPHCDPQAFPPRGPTTFGFCSQCKCMPCTCTITSMPKFNPSNTTGFQFGPWQPQEPTRAREWSSPSPSTTTTTSPDSTPTTLPLPTKGFLLSFDQATGRVTLIRRTTSGETDRRELSSTSQRFELLPLWVSVQELATCWMTG